MRFINDNLLALFAAAMIVVAGIVWISLPEVAQPKTIAPVTETWNLPAPVVRNSTKSIDEIGQRNLWGYVAPVAASSAPPEPTWKVMGIARNGAERFILLAYENKPVIQMKVGDALPDGMKITLIEDDRFFVITSDKKKIAFGMYKNEPTK